MSSGQAEEIVHTYAGLSSDESAKLVGAVVSAAQREALELVTGSSPVPSNLTDARAFRLRFICEELGRLLRPSEIEVVFRVPPTTATSIDSRMRATYPQAIETFLKKVVQDSATVKKTGDAESGFRHEIYFDDPAGLEVAKQLLGRRGLHRDVKARRQSQTLDLPRIIDSTDVLTVLGLKAP